MEALVHGEPEARTAASQLMRRLRDEILRGELAPGSKLNLEELKLRFAVSLSPVREALSRLGAEGLVEIEDQRGYRIAPTSAADFYEVVRLRVEMEGLALGEAIARGDAAWEVELMAASALLDDRSRARQPGDAQVWEAAHRRFHVALLSACAMPLLLRFVTTLHDRSDRYRRLFLKANPADRDVPQEHHRIMEAALERQGEVACALLRQHIRRTGENVARALIDAGADGPGDPVRRRRVRSGPVSR